MYTYKYKPSKSEAKAFAIKMQEIKRFCEENGIGHSKKMDSYYFELGGKKYRVSNHSVQQSNDAAFRDFIQWRPMYHTENESFIDIRSSKKDIIEIYKNLENGVKLDSHGRVIAEK